MTNVYIDKLKKWEDKLHPPPKEPMGPAKTIMAAALLGALSSGLIGLGMRYGTPLRNYIRKTVPPTVREVGLNMATAASGYTAGRYNDEIKRNLGFNVDKNK